ncbi:hypothetical protein [Poriferisphaera sp. WC338]|uniref:hypothetical protein n=1 Tax=Poriferisphaera sp. WC338 TaxID=3425129 RepID=UPI003D815736
MKHKFATISALSAGIIASTAYAQNADFQTIHFETMKHGQVIDQPVLGVSIASMNPDSPASIHDSTVESAKHPGLLGPNGIDGKWAGGNLKNDIVLGNVLAGFHDKSQDGADINFEFSQPVDSFGLDLINIKDASDGSYLRFYNGDEVVGKLMLSDLIDPIHNLYDPTVEFGSTTANRIKPITADDMGTTEFTRVEMHMSADASAIDNVTFSLAKPLSAIYLQQSAPVNAVESSFGSGSATSQQSAPSQNIENLVVLTNIVGTPTSNPDDPNNPPPPPPPPPPPSIPSPSAALAGLGLLGVLGLRRKRK